MDEQAKISVELEAVSLLRVGEDRIYGAVAPYPWTRRLARMVAIACATLCAILLTQCNLRQSVLAEVAKAVITAPVRRGCAPGAGQGLSSEYEKAAPAIMHELLLTSEQSKRLDLHQKELCFLGTVYTTRQYTVVDLCAAGVLWRS